MTTPTRVCGPIASAPVRPLGLVDGKCAKPCYITLYAGPSGPTPCLGGTESGAKTIEGWGRQVEIPVPA